MRGDMMTGRYRSATAGTIDRGTTMSEELAFSMVSQHTDLLVREAADERLLRLGAAGEAQAPSLRIRLGRALIGLGGHIAGVRPVIPPSCDPARPSA